MSADAMAPTKDALRMTADTLPAASNAFDTERALALFAPDPHGLIARVDAHLE